MQGKEEYQHPSGRVPPMMLCPPVMDVLEEGWVVDLDLLFVHSKEGLHWGIGAASRKKITLSWLHAPRDAFPPAEAQVMMAS